ncbi:Mu-like prophage FluMu protein gp28 [Hartmannibacter diazotrophicus]|uniref:Mu-like prophage FluMu protein gp28 n=1 Tax=Hartmannibacter diazotrophicus TaxID=1482074 RepID=A0A2C9D8C7_9HYPH|nr:terminase family protein [Hartmannibacter diazotrophicus]SON55805.1 Mu-like prophage FluMu protein gp28 [Hartmannibacter diazotrophicus]
MSAPLDHEVFGRDITEADWIKLRRDHPASLPETEIFLGYQRKLLATTAVHRVIVYEKSRRTGVTWAAAYDAVMAAGKARAAGGMNVFYMGYNLEMAREFIDTCASWAKYLSEFLDLGPASVGEYLFEDTKGNKDVKAFSIDFASGFSIRALPSRPRSLRGMQGYVIIDEAAFHEDLAELLKAAMALLIWGGKVLLISTHDGAENPFNELIADCRAGRKSYAVLRTDFDEALIDGLYERVCQKAGEDWTPEGEAAWRAGIIADYGDAADEELYCIPSQGSGTWLPSPLIEARMTADAPLLRWELPSDYLHRTELERMLLFVPMKHALADALQNLDKRHRHALGFDFGRVGDLSVLWLLALDQALNRITRLVVEMRRFPHAEQIEVCRAVIRAMPRPTGAAFDAGGEGNGVAEALQREFGIYAPDHPGSGLVEAIKPSINWYRTEMPPLKAAFEDGTVTIIKDADHLDDLRLVKVVSGVPSIPDIRTGTKGKKRHADGAVALAMAYHASRMNAVVDLVIDTPSTVAAEETGALRGAFDSLRRRLWG